MVRHCLEANIDLPLLAAADAIDRSAHIVINSPRGHAAEDSEAVPMGVEEHFVCLLQVGPDQKGPTVRQLDMCDLKLRALVADHGIVLTPIELECLAWAERQRNEYAAARCQLLSPPVAGESSDPTIGAGKAENHQIGMKLLQCSPLLARLPGLCLQPGRQFVGKGIKLARSFRYRERRLDRTRAQILRDRVARQPGAPADLADRLLLSQRHPTDDV